MEKEEAEGMERKKRRAEDRGGKDGGKVRRTKWGRKTGAETILPGEW